MIQPLTFLLNGSKFSTDKQIQYYYECDHRETSALLQLHRLLIYYLFISYFKTFERHNLNLGITCIGL